MHLFFMFNDAYSSASNAPAYTGVGNRIYVRNIDAAFLGQRAALFVLVHEHRENEDVNASDLLDKSEAPVKEEHRRRVS